jgi:predicted dehydrogenase
VVEELFDSEDGSWAAEWAAFLADIEAGSSTEAGPGDGVAAMRIIDALYRSARDGAAVRT